MTKIYDLHDLASLLNARRRSAFTFRVVLAHGAFDWAHLGHARHLQAARQLGEVLVVTVTPSEHAGKGKPGRPIFTENERAEMLASLECVNYVAVNKWGTAAQAIKLLKPAIYVKGMDTVQEGKNRTDGFAQECDALGSVGGKLAFTDEKMFHTTDLLALLAAETKPVKKCACGRGPVQPNDNICAACAKTWID